MSVTQHANTQNANNVIKISSDNIEQEFIKITAEALKIDANKISLESSFVDDLGLDSLDLVELMMAYEIACGIEIPDEEASKIKTVANAVSYIKSVMDSSRAQA